MLVVPFRYNRISTGNLSVSGSVSGNYRRNLNSGPIEAEYNTWGDLNQNLSGTSRESKYVGILGRLSGFQLEKSHGATSEQISVSMTDENGVTNASGSMSSASAGKVNKITKLSGTDTSAPGTTISIDLFNMTGGEYSVSVRWQQRFLGLRS